MRDERLMREKRRERRRRSKSSIYINVIIKINEIYYIEIV
jgi:hypothetical protein